MAVLEILVEPDPRLHRKALPVNAVDDAVCTDLANMVETMYASGGVGLAATQVGILKRLIVMDCAHGDENEDPRLHRFVNPEIIWLSDEKAGLPEGCLSVPSFFEELDRAASCTVAYLDENGDKQERTFSGIESVCIQHEIEHLDGVLFIDHLSRLKRGMIVKKLTKLKKAGVVFHKRDEA